MPQPIGGQPQTFDFQRMQKLVRCMESEPTPYKSVPTEQPPAVTDEQDVIVLKPLKGGDLLQSEAPKMTAEIARDLTSKGIQPQDSLDMIGGVTAQVDSKKASQLKDAGYLLYDNSRRSLVPGFPSRSFVTEADDTTMPKVNAVALTRADKVQAQGFTGKGQVVAVIDSGFDHPATKLVGFKDFVDGSPEPVDPVGHGTHVAGDVLSMAPDAGILSIRVMNGSGQGRPSDIIRGLQYAIANQKKFGITTINMSLGGEPAGFPSHLDPLDRAVETAIKKGITVVAAAGNSGPDAHTIGPPADDPLAISVGASLDRTHVSDFSSRGPTDDDLPKPDLVAPGEFIVSWSVPGSMMDKMGHTVEKLRHMSDDDFVKLLKAKPELQEALKLPPDILKKSPEERLKILHKSLPPIYMPDEQHIAAPGTSFASPIVAGIAAAVRQADPTMPPQRMKDILTKTADPMDSSFGANDQGAGFVNAEKALAAARSRQPVTA